MMSLCKPHRVRLYEPTRTDYCMQTVNLRVCHYIIYYIKYNKMGFIDVNTQTQNRHSKSMV